MGLLKPYVVFDVDKGRDSSHSRSRRNAAEADMAAALYWELRCEEVWIYGMDIDVT